MSRTDATAADRTARIELAVRAACASGRTQWVAQVEESAATDLLGCYAHCGNPDRFFWERRESSEFFVAWGRVDEIESAGSERFADVATWVAGVVSRLHWIGVERPATAPIFFGGFGFEDDGTSATEWKSFPAARFVLPAAIGESLGDRTRITRIARIEPGAAPAAIAAELDRGRRTIDACSEAAARSAVEPEALDYRKLDRADWPAGPEYRVRSDRSHGIFSSQIDDALSAIESGDLEKIVLARRLQVDHDGRLDIPDFLGRLRGIYPSCTLVAIGRGADTFLAATPETLIRIQDDQVETAALAGSAPRGRTPDEDLEIGRALETSAKERAEHDHVVAALRDALATRCAGLEVPETPRLRKLFGIQHLETPISGRLQSPRHGAPRDPGSSPLLRLVADLHPTPAVGGVPAASAREWLRRHEGLDRGWYASPVGWLDGQGGGHFCVALRSALIHDVAAESGDEAASRAWLFAGAGIVAGSRPAAELAETRIKLRALLAPLTEI